MFKKKLFIFILFISNQALSQLVPLNNWYTREINSIGTGDSSRFTSLKPILISSLHKADTVGSNNYLLLSMKIKGGKQKFRERIFNSHLIEYREDNLELFVDPILSLAVGGSNKTDASLFQSSRGVRLKGRAGSKVFFESSFIENETRFTGWIDSVIRNNEFVIPGYANSRYLGNASYDYSRSGAAIGFEASSHFTAILGYGKNFIGDGYRSLLLSDNSFNYPYLRMDFTFKRIRYSALYLQLTNPRYSIGDRYQRKFAAMHYATALLGKKWQVSLFESVVWQGEDSISKRGFDLHYLHPLLFLKTAQYSLNSPDNSLFGMNIKFQAGNKTFLYGQVMMDDFNFGATRRSRQQHLNNKYGLQFGLWTSDPFKLKGISYRFELNTARPYSYGHRKTSQNYTHYNQALAHPLGANFYEMVNQIHYTNKRWYGGLHSVVAVTGRNFDGHNYGTDLWGGEEGLNMFGHTMLQGIKTNFSFTSVQLGWILNPAMNMRIELMGGKRIMVNRLSKQNEHFFTIGLITSLENIYHDF